MNKWFELYINHEATFDFVGTQEATGNFRRNYKIPLHEFTFKIKCRLTKKLVCM